MGTDFAYGETLMQPIPPRSRKSLRDLLATFTAARWAATRAPVLANKIIFEYLQVLFKFTIMGASAVARAVARRAFAIASREAGARGTGYISDTPKAYLCLSVFFE